MAKNDFDELMSVGIDIGKEVFHLVGFDCDGQLVLRKKGSSWAECRKPL